MKPPLLTTQSKNFKLQQQLVEEECSTTQFEDHNPDDEEISCYSPSLIPPAEVVTRGEEVVTLLPPSCCSEMDVAKQIANNILKHVKDEISFVEDLLVKILLLRRENSDSSLIKLLISICKFTVSTLFITY